MVQRDLYQWASLVDRAGAIIAEDGLLGSRLFSLAREFGIPAMFGLAGAMEKLTPGDKVTVCTEMGCVFTGQLDELLAQARPPRDYLPGSPVYRVLQLWRNISFPDHRRGQRGFQGANLPDLSRYRPLCQKGRQRHVHPGVRQAVRDQRIGQLRDKVLKQFWSNR